MRGKRGKGVPILLTEEMVDTLELLVERRAASGVSAQNTYLFTSGTEADAAPLRGSDCVRIFS